MITIENVLNLILGFHRDVDKICPLMGAQILKMPYVHKIYFKKYFILKI
jgi:hypothetical protein